MDGLPMYETLAPEPPDAECPAGGEHEPVTEDLSFSGNFWGQPVLEQITTTNCAKCGRAIEPLEPDTD